MSVTANSYDWCPTDCSIGALFDSHYCGDSGTDCVQLAQLSQGCMGSHTETPCRMGGTDYIRVGGDDAATLYFDAAGALVALQAFPDPGRTAGLCVSCWFGEDLSECEATGPEITVPCQ